MFKLIYIALVIMPFFIIFNNLNSPHLLFLIMYLYVHSFLVMLFAASRKERGTPDSVYSGKYIKLKNINHSEELSHWRSEYADRLYIKY